MKSLNQIINHQPEKFYNCSIKNYLKSFSMIFLYLWFYRIVYVLKTFFILKYNFQYMLILIIIVQIHKRPYKDHLGRHNSGIVFNPLGIKRLELTNEALEYSPVDVFFLSRHKR